MVKKSMEIMTEKHIEKIITLTEKVGYRKTAKLLGVTLVNLFRLTGQPIDTDTGVANEILIEGIKNEKLPTKYKEFEISVSTDDVVYWEGKLYTDQFLPNMKETIWVMATPFWDGMTWTPVETDWYSLVNEDNDTLISEIEGGGDYYEQLEKVDLFSDVDDLFSWYKKVYLPSVYEIIMDNFLPKLQDDMHDRLDDNMGYSPIRESIVRALKEEERKQFLKPSNDVERGITNRLNKVFSDVNMYHSESYKTRHDFEFCKNGKKMMNLILYFDNENDYNTPTSERKFVESHLVIPKMFVDTILKFFPVRRNYLHYLIEEWFETNFLDRISNKMGRDDISIDELSFIDRVDVCVPPVTEKPEGVTQDDMIKVIMKNTLWRKNDLLSLEEREPGSIESMYLNKLRNLEMDRLEREG
jgi:hypothetical protein